MTDDINLKTQQIDPAQASQHANMIAAGQVPSVHINNFLIMQADEASVRVVFSESFMKGIPPVARCSVVLRFEAAAELAVSLRSVLDKIVEATEAAVAKGLDNQESGTAD